MDGTRIEFDSKVDGNRESERVKVRGWE